jgi:hypothetical protein
VLVTRGYPLQPPQEKREDPKKTRKNKNKKSPFTPPPGSPHLAPPPPHLQAPNCSNRIDWKEGPIRPSFQTERKTFIKNIHQTHTPYKIIIYKIGKDGVAHIQSNESEGKNMTKGVVLPCIKNKDKIIMNFNIIGLDINPIIHKHAKMNF